MAEVSLVGLSLDESHWTELMLRQHWFRYWLGAVRQQAITWANVDPDLCRHMASPGHNEIIHVADRPRRGYKHIRDKVTQDFTLVQSHVIWVTLFVPRFIHITQFISFDWNIFSSQKDTCFIAVLNKTFFKISLNCFIFRLFQAHWSIWESCSVPQH